MRPVAACVLGLSAVLAASCLGPMRPAEWLDPNAAAPVPDAATSAVVKGNTHFALDLYGRLRAKEGNQFFSPYSISTALAMTSAGAAGETLRQMAATLHLPEQDELHPAMGKLRRDINRRGGTKVELRDANALWGQRGVAFRADFLRRVRGAYGAGLREVDFAGSPEAARETINAWAARETRDRIQGLLPSGSVKKSTRLVLTNAIYFKGDWGRGFDKAASREGTFTRADGRQVKAMLMRQEETFGYNEGPDWQALAMPYAGGELDMVVLLPGKADGLAALEAKLTPDSLAEMMTGLREQRVDVTLPRFKAHCQYNLESELAAMGMGDAFSQQANFAGLCDGPEKLLIDRVVHKAFVEVGEQGTEAAAATAVTMTLVRAAVEAPRERVPVFRADRPFVFLIRDRKTGSVLFLGRLADPTA